jgi:DNA helicase-2/ATP-dependent DNA helicase PcrA
MLSTKPRTSWENAVNSAESVERFLRERGRGKASGLRLGAPRRGSGRWKLGSQVRHPKFGLGTVLDCEGEGEDAKLTVSFPGYGQKKFVERYAPLEKA